MTGSRERWGRAAVWLAALGISFALLSAIAAVASVLTFTHQQEVGFTFVVGAAAVVWGSIGALIGRRRPDTSLGTVLAAESFLLGGALLADGLTHRYPGSPLASGLADAQGYVVLILLIVPLVLLIFPTGRPPTKRWNIGLWLFGVSAVTGVVALGLAPERSVPWSPAASWLARIAGAAGLAGAAIAIAAVIVRFHRSRDVERAQMRWLAIVAIVAAVFLLVALPGGTSGLGQIAFVLLLLTAAVGLPAAIGVAILRHGLWDIEVVIRKARVALGLTLLIVVPAALLLGLSSQFLLWGVPTRTCTLVGGVALGLSLIPLYRVARRIANRVAYGKRATPYEVLASFSDRVGETYAADDVLDRIAQVLASGTGSTRARVLLKIDGELREAASYGDGGGDEHSTPVRFQGDELGALAITMPPSDPIDPPRERLVSDLAAQAGPVLHNVRLIEELRASRQRLVVAQDAERRKLERNIHDGVQQQLIALAVKLRLADALVDRDPPKAHEALSSLQGDAGAALDDLRDLARGIYPPLLADKGLGAALESQARKAAVPTTVETGGVGRYHQDVEAAVYFCSLEALNNVAKYSEATQATITLAANDGVLMFRIADDGHGFDVADRAGGTGLQGMRDRLDAIGGTLVVTSSPNAGTTVEGRTPAEPLVDATEAAPRPGVPS